MLKLMFILDKLISLYILFSHVRIQTYTGDFNTRSRTNPITNMLELNNVM